jgi:hypothetical protein
MGLFIEGCELHREKAPYANDLHSRMLSRVLEQKTIDLYRVRIQRTGQRTFASTKLCLELGRLSAVEVVERGVRRVFPPCWLSHGFSPVLGSEALGKMSHPTLPQDQSWSDLLKRSQAVGAAAGLRYAAEGGVGHGRHGKACPPHPGQLLSPLDNPRMVPRGSCPYTVHSTMDNYKPSNAY